MRRTFKLVLEILLLFLLILGTVSLLRPIRSGLSSRMMIVRDSLIAQAEQELGRKIFYASMGPSLFGAIDIRSVRLVGSDGKPVLTVDRIRISYSLWDLLLKRDARAVRSVTLDRPMLSWDSTRDADLLDRFKGNPDSPSRISRRDILAISFRIRSGSLLIQDGSARYDISDLNLSNSLRDGKPTFKARARMSTVLPGPLSGLGTVHSACTIEGELDEAADSGSMTVSIPETESDRLVLKSQTFLAVFNPERFELRKIKNRSPFDLYARYDRRSASWESELKMDGFALNDVLGLRGPWKSWETWLETQFSGSVGVASSPKEGLQYRFSVDASVPAAGNGVARVYGFGKNRALSFDEVSFHQKGRELAWFSGQLGLEPFVLTGNMRFSDFPIAKDLPLNGAIACTTRNGTVNLFAENLGIGSVALSAFSANLTQSDGDFAFNLSALRFSNPEDYENIHMGKILLDGTFNRSEPLLQFSLTLDSFSAGELLRPILPFLSDSRALASALGPLDELRLTTELFVTTDFKSLSFNAPRLVAAHTGVDAFLVTSLSGSDKHMSLQDLSLIWSGGAAKANLDVDYSDSRTISFAARAFYREMTYSLDGMLMDGNTLSIQGNYGLKVDMLFSPDEGTSGTFAVDKFPVPFGDSFLNLSTSLDLRLRSLSQWRLLLNGLTLENNGATAASPFTLRMRGKADQAGASLDDISLDDGRGLLSGTVAAHWEKGFASTNGTARISDAVGDELYDLEGELRDGKLYSRLNLVHAKLERFGVSALRGLATGELRLEASRPADYQLSWRMSDLHGVVGSDALSFSGSGLLTPDQLEMEGLKLTFSDYFAEIPLLQLDRQKALLSTNFLVRGLTIGHEALVTARAETTLSPLSSWIDLPKAFKTSSTEFDVEQARIGAIASTKPFKLGIQSKDGGFSVDGGPDDSIRFRSNEHGDFFASLSAPSPMRGTVTGRLADGRIDATANNLSLDFASLWGLLPNLPVTFTGGTVLASVHITGPVGDPEFAGSATADGLRLTVPDWVEGELGPASTVIAFNGNEFDFGPIDVPVASGKARVTGSFQFDRWIPSNFKLLIDVPQDFPVPAKANVSGVIGKGNAFGHLLLQNTPGDFIVKGNLNLDRTTITLNTAALMASGSQNAGPLPVQCDLTLTTGRKVEFVWPSTDFPVIRGYADAGNSLKIYYDGMSGKFNLTGDIDLKGGEVFYFQRSFYLRDGMLHFAENELRFDPKISLRAEVHDRTDAGSVVIALVVDNAPLLSFTPRLESQPPLSQVEIFTLLGQNMMGYTAGGETSLQNTLLSASTDIVAQFNFIHRFEGNARDFLGLDMFSVRTQIIQNAVLEAAGLRSDPVDSNGSLGNYFDNTTVYMGKFIGSDLFLQAMLSLQVNENNTTDPLGGIEFKPDIGLEMKTPLFLVRWSFLPEHPENLFINDNSFTITWKKSF